MTTKSSACEPVFANDLLRDITAESLARQQKAIHEIQWLMKLYDWRHTLNN